MCKEKQIFYEGQQVGCLMFGEGVLSDILSDGFKVELRLHNRTVYYTKEGKYTTDSRPTLYPIEQYRAIIANLPAPEPEKWQPKQGEWCWFWDECDKIQSAVVLRKFKRNRYTDEKGVNWQYCAPFTGELPEHLKEVQP